MTATKRVCARGALSEMRIPRTATTTQTPTASGRTTESAGRACSAAGGSRTNISGRCDREEAHDGAGRMTKRATTATMSRLAFFLRITWTRAFFGSPTTSSTAPRANYVPRTNPSFTPQPSARSPSVRWRSPPRSWLSSPAAAPLKLPGRFHRNTGRLCFSWSARQFRRRRPVFQPPHRLPKPARLLFSGLFPPTGHPPRLVSSPRTFPWCPATPRTREPYFSASSRFRF
mmetsp:Transcript_1500/g.5099  ORF Transcript_1500/g.5099 Transcript_1500/m.5099 type:complete len:230 (-) Transcript_1500:1010-1699(-)